MFDDPLGPIQHFSWGKFIIGGKEHGESEGGTTGVGKDIRLIGHEPSRWEERQGHKLRPKMITGVFGKEIEVLVIGTGVHGFVRVPKKVQHAIEENGIHTLIAERTPDACRTYNRLYREGRQVALLAHGTC